MRKIKISAARRNLVKNNKAAFSRSLGRVYDKNHLPKAEMKKIISTGKLSVSQTRILNRNITTLLTSSLTRQLTRNSKSISTVVRSQLGKVPKVDVSRTVNSNIKTLATNLQKQQRASMRTVAKYKDANLAMLKASQALTGRDAKRLVRIHSLTAAEHGKRVANREFFANARLVKKRRVKSLAVTETNRNITAAARAQFEVAGADGWRVWDAGQDGCPICEALHGTRVPIGSSFSPDPPAHPNCDCSIDYEIQNIG